MCLRGSQKLRFLLAVAVAVLIVGLAGRFYWLRAYPQISDAQYWQVTFPRGIAGATEPLVATGHFGNADFLCVRYIDSDHAVITYDTWGYGGPSSPVFELRSGTEHTVCVQMPSLRELVASSPGHAEPLRFILDGIQLLSTNVSHHGRTPREVYFGTNPIGGNPAAEFRGVIHAEKGIALHGGAFDRLAFTTRVHVLFSRFGSGLLAMCAIGIGLVSLSLRGSRGRNEPAPPAGVVRAAAGFSPAAVLASAGAALLFIALMTGGRFNLNYPDSFGAFYDSQAVSLLEGHLDVPAEALPNEAFIVGGKFYGYFGPTPALLRIPFVLLGVGFGHLTRGLMLLYFCACLVTAPLLGRAWRELSGAAGTGSRTALLIGAIAGSSLLFLADRAYVYHEAILCGAALALLSGYFTLKYLRDPEARAWIGSAIFGLFSLHARPPAGLFALAALGFAAVCHLGRAVRARSFRAGYRGASRAVAIGGVAVACVLSFNALSYLKFGTFDGAPLRFHMQYDAERLARFGGKNFHITNVPHNLATYFYQPNFNFQRRFPWVFVGGNEGAFPEAKLDLAEPTIAIPYAMPALCALASIGIASGILQRKSRAAVVVFGAAFLVMTMALLTAIATAQRYTADFCPFLIILAALGTCAIDSWSPRTRRLNTIGIAALAALSIGITLAIALFHQNELVWGTPAETRERYQRIRQAVEHSR